MNPPPTLPSDRQLLDAARRGDDAAWTELTSRHRPALVELIGSGRAARRRVDDVIDIARRRLLAEPAAPEGTPDLRAVRPSILAAHTDGFYGPRWPGVLSPSDAATPPPIIGDQELLAVAFATLPEPWQTALWHRAVDGLDAASIAPFVGRVADDVDELLVTAERGLIDAFFREYERIGPFGPDAAVVVPLLAGYHHGTLSTNDQEVVREHLVRDRIAIAPPPPPPPPPPASGASAAAPASSPLAAPDPTLAPPALRTHDAVDSRRLLDLVSSLDERLAPAIAPGVTDMTSETTPAAAAASDGDRRRRWAAVAAVALVVLGVAGAAIIIGNTGSDEADGPDATDGATASTAVSPGTDPGTDPDDDPPTTPSPTTSLALRPEAEGPLNTITVAVDPDAEPLGFAPAQSDGVTVLASTPAPVFAGGSGTIDVAVLNSDEVDRTVGLAFSLPRGIRFDGSTGGVCVDPEDASPRCTVDVPAGGAASIAVRVRLETSVVGRLQVDGDVVEPLVTPIVATPQLVHSSVGRGDVVVIGNTVTRCDAAAARQDDIDCSTVADGTGEIVNRWDVPIEFVGAASQFALFNSSSAVLEIPDDAEVVAAHLYWSGDLDERGATIPDDGRNTTIALGLPGGNVRTIEAGRVVLGDVDASQYLGSNDVTEFVRSGGPGLYTVGNVQTVEVQGSYGAWALVVVYDHEDEPRRHRVITRPFEWVAPEDESSERYEYEVDMPVPVSDGAIGQLDVFALEGELGFAPERLSVGGVDLGGDNPFDSTVSGERQPDEVNSLGVDIDTYDLTIDATDGLLPIRATSEKDGIRIAVLGLTVDLAS